MSETTEILKRHRANIADAKSFDDFLSAQLSYVDLLIKRAEADDAKQEATQNFLVTYRVVDGVDSSDGVGIEQP